MLRQVRPGSRPSALDETALFMDLNDVTRLCSTEDLWDCLEQASGKPIAAVMGSWTKQMGFPIIVVDQEQVSFSAGSPCSESQLDKSGSAGLE